MITIDMSDAAKTINLSNNDAVITMETVPGQPGPKGDKGDTGAEGVGITNATVAGGLRRAATYLWPAMQGGTARVVYMGDSKVEGSGLKARMDRWQDQVTEVLRGRFSPPGGDQGVGYVPAYYVVGFDDDLADIRPTLSAEGCEKLPYDGGLGVRSVRLKNGKAASVTWKSQAGLSYVRVWYTNGDDAGHGGTAEVLINGSLRGSITPTAGVRSGQYVEYACSPTTTSTVVVRIKSNSSKDFCVEGVEFRTSSIGIQGYDGSHAGFQTEHYAQGDAFWNAPDSDLRHWEAVKKIDPHLICVGLGANDLSSLTADRWEENVKIIADRVRDNAPNAGLLWVMTAYDDMDKRAEFETRLRAVMLPYPNTSLVYETSLFQQQNEHGSDQDADPQNVWTDENGGIHPNPKGNAAITRMVTESLFASGARTTTHFVEGTAAGGAATTGSVPIPLDAVYIDLVIQAPGNGGGSGRRGAAGSVRCGGGGGGAGAYGEFSFRVADLPAGDSAIFYRVSTAGKGGAAVTADDTNGNDGSSPGAHSWLATRSNPSTSQYLLMAQSAAVAAGRGGTASTGTGGVTTASTFLSATGGSASSAGGVGGAGAAAVGSTRGAGAGGAGGGLTSGDVASVGGSGGYAGGWNQVGGAAGATGAAGGDGQNWSWLPKGSAGCGAGGGGASKDGVAGKGGNGADYGAGGGGGGASLNGNASGAGGDGGRGYVRITFRG